MEFGFNGKNNCNRSDAVDVSTEAATTEQTATDETTGATQTTGLYCAYRCHSIIHGDAINHTVGNSDSKRCQYSFAFCDQFEKMASTPRSAHHACLQPTLYLVHVVFI